MDKKSNRSKITREDCKEFGEVLNFLKIKLVKYDPSKQRPVSTNITTYNMEKFAKTLKDSLGAQGAKFQKIFQALHDFTELEPIIEQFAKDNGVLIAKDRNNIETPKDMIGLKLNFNMSAQGRDSKFFLTDEKEQVSRISGEAYIIAHQMSQQVAVTQSRCVIPEYRPREKSGISIQNNGFRSETIFNSYHQPPWLDYKDWIKLPSRPPKLVKKLIDHLVTNKQDRIYLRDWIYASLFMRAPTYLVLCGDPGIGKNRLKLLLRALHGFNNTIDGKKSTITEKFNGQIPNATLVWFDELQYDFKMENTMKELHNDTLSIERKGIDATRATKIHASFVISNNKPRDNYISFDARKFAPLQLTKNRLETSMTSDEIDLLTKKIEDPQSSSYDIKFIAETAKWIKSRGIKGDWRNLEYRGPMFWYLAHTSMSHFQKRVIHFLNGYEFQNRFSSPEEWNDIKKAFQWSKLQYALTRKFKDMSIPDYTTTQIFFENFRTKDGLKAFETEVIEENVLGDFWLKPLSKNMQVDLKEDDNEIFGI